ncbi:MAG TPA: DUF6580 family putative transport protein [Planctomycetaceae bacterium]|nr:DUF6580 family putative transport protein [Planctomycetaceae bacterium]
MSVVDSKLGRSRWALPVGMILFCTAIRLVPWVLQRMGVDTTPNVTLYPWNFAPMTAVCLFGGACLADRRLAFIVPLAAHLVGDVGIALLTNTPNFGFYPGQGLVYACFLLSICLGLWLRNHRNVAAIAVSGILAESVFFIVTNLGMWYFGTWYAHTAAGLAACYIAAIPFFGRSLASTAMYSAALFGGYALLEGREPSAAPELVEVRS